jgi:hypothetical protein
MKRDNQRMSTSESELAGRSDAKMRGRAEERMAGREEVEVIPVESDLPIESDIVPEPPREHVEPRNTAEQKRQDGSVEQWQPADSRVRLFADREASTFRDRWTDIQASFVDEPRKAVQEADALVSETTKRLAEVFADERGKLEGQWDRGNNVTTEDLRVALQRYRTFFDRLLSV